MNGLNYMNKVIYVEIGNKGMGYALTEPIRLLEASPSIENLEEAIIQTTKQAFKDSQNPRAYNEGTDLLDWEALLKQKEIVIKLTITDTKSPQR